jgi:hypothetical protein
MMVIQQWLKITSTLEIPLLLLLLYYYQEVIVVEKVETVRVLGKV